MIFRFLLLLPLAVVGSVQQAQPEGSPSGPTESVNQQDLDVDKQDGSPEQTVIPAQVFLERLPIYEMKNLARAKHTTGNGKDTREREEQGQEQGQEQGERRTHDRKKFILFLNVNRTQETRQHPVCYTCMCSQECPAASKAEANQSHTNVFVLAEDWFKGSRERGGKEDKVRSGRCRGRENKVRSGRCRGRENKVRSGRCRGKKNKVRSSCRRGKKN
ncbi:uncharacterized protein LOC122257861 [Penaeus japonicus]|uniref:uncharacterized protein LOC122257861 n=1 Tax=Penaeus japonicus TaxID=27405 RepID=UPI001C70B102|nr:uncharacterized protein LOC122257861 [Penaeus japonicus]